MDSLIEKTDFFRFHFLTETTSKFSTKTKSFGFVLSRYEDLYKMDYCNCPKHKKVRLVLRKVGAVEHMKFVNYILPKKNW